LDGQRYCVREHRDGQQHGRAKDYGNFRLSERLGLIIFELNCTTGAGHPAPDAAPLLIVGNAA